MIVPVNASDTDFLMKTMDMNKSIVELDLQEKFRELRKENNSLYEELERHETSIANLKQQHNITEKKLECYVKKCQQLETENDEQGNQLNEFIKKEKTMTVTLHKYMKEHENLLKELETAKIELQVIPHLKEKLEKITKENMDYLKIIAKMQKDFEEMENNYEHLKSTIIELENTKINTIESYEYIIHNLRKKNRLLTDENEELQSLSAVNMCPVFQERLSISPISGDYLHTTPYKEKEVPMEDSLYMELKASGFIVEQCNKNELEEELNEYNSVICVILEQLEKVIQFFVTLQGSIDDLSRFVSQDTNARTYNINTLKHKTACLLHMATKEITKRNMRRDSSTQLRVDPTNTADNFIEFGIRNFQDLLSTHTYCSIYTLSTNLQSFSTTKYSWTFDYQNSNMDISDTSFVQEDGLTKAASDTQNYTKAHDVSNSEDLILFKEKRLHEVPKMSSILQRDSKTFSSSKEKEEQTNSKSIQISEVNSASNPTSPRRKISVYCRSFDVVAVQDQPNFNLEVRQSQSNQDITKDQDNMLYTRYSFNHIYRNVKSDNDSSNDSTPRKLQEYLLDDESPVKEPVVRKIHLAPTRLKFPQEAKDVLNTIKTSNCAFSVPMNSTKLDGLNLSLSPVGEQKEVDASVYLSPTFVDENKIEMKNVPVSNSYFNKNASQTYLISNLLPREPDPKSVDLKNPHSTSAQRVDSESQLQVKQSVDNQMLNREDSLIISDNKCESFDNQCDSKIANEDDKVVNIVSSTPLADPIIKKRILCKSNEKAHEYVTSKTKRDIQQRLVNMKRSHSEGENLSECSCRCRNNASLIRSETKQCEIFPSLTDIRLQESRISNLAEFEEIKENLSELELQKRYTAFSLCLSIDRLTLPQRIATSCRQRDQTEKNLSYEMQKMQQDIQELAPLCTDRESVERVERVRHQLDMIMRCAHRVSCAAETLGAVHQERKVSRAILLVDKYLRVLQSRCEKLIANIAETKRILVKNNIVVEENFGELYDELPCTKYRTGTLVNNRMMMTRRRASVATMSRPCNTQDVIKEAMRQRKSVPGRMTIRRPSLELLKWETEKLDGADCNSIGELRDIFEQAESHRNSKEENNNMSRTVHSNSQSTINCVITDDEVWTNVKEESLSEFSDSESINSDTRSSTRSQSIELGRLRRRRLWYIILLGILIFCFVFYMFQALSVNTCHASNKQFISIFYRFRQTKNEVPYPM